MIHVDFNKMTVKYEREYTVINLKLEDKINDNDLSLMLDKMNYARDNIQVNKSKNSDKNRKRFFAMQSNIKKQFKKDATVKEIYAVNSIIHSKLDCCYNCRSEYFKIYRREVIVKNELKVTCLCKNCKDVKVFNINLAK